MGSGAAALPAGANNRIVTVGFEGTWQELGALDERAGDTPAAAAYLVDSHLEALRAVWRHAIDPEGRETLIAGSGRVGAEQADGFRADGLALVRGDAVEPATTEREPQRGRVWLLTSGSTGRPKQVAHTLDSLTTVAGEQPARTWLCPYAVGAYAWWQVVTLSLSLPGQNVLFIEPSQLDEWPGLALEAGVTAASGTPTFWRQALWRSGDTMKELPLQQVTLGGEPVDQAVLDTLRSVYPEARLSWIYASSEAGAAIAVHDGLAGFPAAWLDRQTPGRPRLSVVDDELVIASSKAAEGMDAAIHTGDRVEIENGRVRIVGRLASDEINVGGSKASAAKVRAVLLDHPAVAWAAVKGRKAPLVGMVVAAEVVLDPAAEPVTDAELQAWCAARLPDYSVPRRIRVRDEIPLKETLKSDV
ncbi:AMP-binding protein [Calidifontibacter terrae]